MTFGVYYAPTAIYLALFAAVWRAAGEVVALLAAVAAPPRATGVRRAVEITCALGYYAGTIGLLVLRFWP